MPPAEGPETHTHHPHPACLDPAELLKQCTITTGPNAGGPGGQNRNKLATHVQITHDPTGISAQAGEWRTQVENKKAAIKRLRIALAIGHRAEPPGPPPVSGKTREEFLASLDATIGQAGAPARGCSELWLRRLKSSRGSATERINVNPDHTDFPSILAEALDHIASYQWEPKPAAQRLGVTTSQLIKLVKECPPAQLMWNQQRAKRGLHGMK